ncbi:hypothetical protein CFAM422_008809 [Trichoderma lentiforme]|uniref:Uncharacterized protein n=1 Tax=Trichoderma lentiforme TaxID=1567552 RepID=A0A9P4XB63_9HYPO|nr:hypothetical protein CFAM422_008809 [Trichoderma lentiforme]
MSPCEDVRSADKLEVSGMEEDDGSAGDSPSALSCPCYVEYSVVRQRQVAVLSIRPRKAYRLEYWIFHTTVAAAYNKIAKSGKYVLHEKAKFIWRQQRALMKRAARQTFSLAGKVSKSMKSRTDIEALSLVEQVGFSGPSAVPMNVPEKGAEADIVGADIREKSQYAIVFAARSTVNDSPSGLAYQLGHLPIPITRNSKAIVGLLLGDEGGSFMCSLRSLWSPASDLGGDGGNTDTTIGPLCLGAKGGAQKIRHIAFKTKARYKQWQLDGGNSGLIRLFMSWKPIWSIAKGGSERQDAVWLA